MKFIVDKVEIVRKENEDRIVVDGKEVIRKVPFDYYKTTDEEGKDWYEELKKFRKDTLKVMYNKDSRLVLSTHTDASMLAPTMGGIVVEEIEYQEVQVNPNLYFVDGKLVELPHYETVENGKIVFNRDLRINEIKQELSELKTEYSEREFIFKDEYVQKNRELDKNNLNSIVTMLMFSGKDRFEGWKFKDKQGNDVYVTLMKQDIVALSDIMTAQTTKAMHTERKILKKLDNLTDDELKEFNVKEEFEKEWNKI